MDKIQVKVIDQGNDPGGMMMFLAKLTQRGHNIKNMDDLLKLYNDSAFPDSKVVRAVSGLPHGTIKRFCPITIAIVGASRRFLAQARTNQVGFNYVSASLQYSDYSGEADFVVPYEIMEKGDDVQSVYLKSCENAMSDYKWLIEHEGCSNDTAGYAAPQGLRNILIMQANHQAWDYFIRLRGCNRNTVETQYVTMLIWEALLGTEYGEEFFGRSGSDCMNGGCREGRMTCGDPMRKYRRMAEEAGKTVPRLIIDEKWPLLG